MAPEHQFHSKLLGRLAELRIKSWELRIQDPLLPAMPWKTDLKYSFRRSNPDGRLAQAD